MCINIYTVLQDLSINHKNGLLCTNSLCASYLERAIKDMWSQTEHVGNK